VGRRFVSHRQSRSQRRKTAWGVGPEAVDVSGSASGHTLWTNGVSLNNEEQATITRIHGVGQIVLLTAAAAGDGYFGAMGFGIVTAEALAGGVTTVPSALVDANWDGWMWHQFLDIRAVTATIADGVNAMSATLRFQIESKAQRILRSDDVLFGSIDMVESGTATWELQADTRMLLILP